MGGGGKEWGKRETKRDRDRNRDRHGLNETETDSTVSLVPQRVGQ